MKSVNSIREAFTYFSMTYEMRANLQKSQFFAGRIDYYLK